MVCLNRLERREGQTIEGREGGREEKEELVSQLTSNDSILPPSITIILSTLPSLPPSLPPYHMSAREMKSSLKVNSTKSTRAVPGSALRTATWAR